MALLEPLLIWLEQNGSLALPLLVALGFGMSSFAVSRRGARSLRLIAAWEALPYMLEESAGQGRPVHLSTGGAGLQGSDTLLALAGAEAVYQAARQAQGPVIPDHQCHHDDPARLRNLASGPTGARFRRQHVARHPALVPGRAALAGLGRRDECANGQ